jgi:hypothetical protein
MAVFLLLAASERPCYAGACRKTIAAPAADHKTHFKNSGEVKRQKPP